MYKIAHTCKKKRDVLLLRKLSKIHTGTHCSQDPLVLCSPFSFLRVLSIVECAFENPMHFSLDAINTKLNYPKAWHFYVVTFLIRGEKSISKRGGLKYLLLRPLPNISTFSIKLCWYSSNSRVVDTQFFYGEH